MREIVAINNIERRPPEAGRIRIGVKAGRAMKAIDTFRFTSPHVDAIKELARLYGGEAKPWDEPMANKGQWEVITKANKLEILAQPGGVSQSYELWGGGGCTRRCDGVECEVPRGGPEADLVMVPCICTRNGVAECHLKTRLVVILPTIDFYGVWRLDTKGWNASKELPGMYDMVTQLAETGSMVRAHLNLEQRTSKSNGKTQHFVVPTISLAATPNQLLQGEGLARAQMTVGEDQTVGQIESGSAPNDHDPGFGDFAGDNDIVDAEIIEVAVIDPEREDELEGIVRTIAEMHQLDPDPVVATLWEQANGDIKKIESFIKKAESDRRLGFTKEGKLTWRMPSDT